MRPHPLIQCHAHSKSIRGPLALHSRPAPVDDGPVITRALTLLAFLTTLFPAVAAKPSPPPDHWVGTWATAPFAEPNSANLFAADTTLRQIVHVSLGGPLVRIEFTNEFGAQPLSISATHIALAAAARTDLQLSSANALTFGGSPSITIPPGATALSDPAALTLPDFADLAITLFLPAQSLSTLSTHQLALQTSYSIPGNRVSAASLNNPIPLTPHVDSPTSISEWYFLKAVDVRMPADTGAVIAFGDSITDGYRSAPNTNQRWPDLLAHRLHNDKKLRTLAVLNEGIGGNRLLHDNTGPSALARFDRDVLSRPGVRFLILLEGINDIGRATGPSANPADPVATADLTQALEQALAQLSERAHTHGIKVLCATLTPFTGAGYATPAGETIRQSVNQWIRTTIAFDGFIDFDKATQDKSNPAVLSSTTDSGDHLHPSDAGYKQMADSIDLKLFLPTASYDIRREP